MPKSSKSKDTLNSTTKQLKLKKEKVERIENIEVVSENIKENKFTKFKNKILQSRYVKIIRKKLKLFASIFLLFVIIVTAGYLLYPYLPALKYKLNPPDPNYSKYNFAGAEKLGFKVDEKSLPLPSENRLVIPSIDVDTEILEGKNVYILGKKEGVWREPYNDKNPTLNGNMTIAGHRFQYLPPNTTTFYNLDKVKNGDQIIVFWQKKVYIYKVFKTFEVYPDQVDIRNDSEKSKEITIYTCTPLGSNSKRLVVKAEVIFESEN